MSMAQRKTRPRNQRVSNVRQRRQQHLLDVKVRSQKATQHRNRRVLVIASKILLAGVVCTGIYIGGRAGVRRFLFDNPDYRLTKIEVRSDGTLQRDQVINAAGLVEGENIFHVNLAKTHDMLQQLPQVDDVQIVRKMPNEIDIQITERKPIAWITSGKEIEDVFSSDTAFLVDARGVLMKEKKLLPEYLGLPLITGCSSEPLEAGKAVESFEAKAALDLLRLSTRSFMQTRFQVRDIDVSKGYCLIVTDKNHTRVTFAFDNLEAQLQRLEQFLVWSDDSKRELSTVNLLVQRNIPVTFTQPASEVINDTLDPTEQPRIMRAIPVNVAAAKPATARSDSKQQAAAIPQPSAGRRAVANQKGKKD